MQLDTQKLREYYANPPEDVSLEDVDLGRLPRHVSIIMDGNGRWAQARGLDRSRGHVAGVDALREAVTTSVRLGLDALSVYAFSTENWRRPQREVDLLMHLFATTLVKELPLFHQENVRLRFLGDLTALLGAPYWDSAAEASITGMTRSTGRAEIARAAREIALDVASGALSPEDVDEDSVSSRLYTAGLPDPDLLIRTSGEMRLSNYLLWQLAYTEFYVTETYWPDFSRWDFLRAVAAYQGRSRRFGGVAAS